jgi:nascent polypeptide-associated complex subunit alpha
MTEFAEEPPKVEEVDSDDEEDTEQTTNKVVAPETRGDKKTRKAMQKMGMKPVPGVTRVAMKKSKQIVFAINNPEVYKSATSNTYIVVGEAKVEEVSGGANQAAQAAAQQYSKVQMPNNAGDALGAAKPGIVEDNDETGVEANDIELVMGQANCTRGQAIAALKNNENDIVNAIMELTM